MSAGEHTPAVRPSPKMDARGELFQATCSCGWSGVTGSLHRARAGAAAHGAANGARGGIAAVPAPVLREYVVTRTWHVRATSVGQAIDMAAPGLHVAVDVGTPRELDHQVPARDDDYGRGMIQ